MFVRLLIAILLAGYSGITLAGDVEQSRPEVVAAIDRGLGFLVKDALAWKEARKCASCHHAALVVWSMQEARRRGHVVNEPMLADLTKWMAEAGSGKVSLPRPESAPKAFNSKALFFGLALTTDPEPDEVSQNGMKLLLETVKEDQTESGAWSAWPETRPPIFGPSDEIVTTMATLSLLPAAAAGDEAAMAARDKGVAWLTSTKSDDDPQSLAMRLVLWRRLERPAKEWQPLVDRIRERQDDDGGWRQAADMASDAWATGQALYALAHAGLDSRDPAVQRGQDFLVRTQGEDGSWPMTSRPSKPGVAGASNLVPITGAGTAWGVIGLARSR
jgi:hypothetical protein